MWIKYDSLCWACWTENLNLFLAKQGQNIVNNWAWGKKHVFTIAFLLYWNNKLHGFLTCNCPKITKSMCRIGLHGEANVILW